MKYGIKEISSLTDDELINADLACLEAETRREAASKHHKFDKLNNQKAMEFPPPNFKFVELKSEISAELKKRNIKE